MDPNAALTDLRAARGEAAKARQALTSAIDSGNAEGGGYAQHEEQARDDLLDALDRVEESAEALDDWLSKGGFKPADWVGRKPTVVVIENPQENPGFETFGDVEVSTMTSYPFSRYAEADETERYTQDCLAMLRDPAQPEDFRTWLRGWLEAELDLRERAFTVDWDSLTLVVHEIPAGVRATLTPAKRQCFWIDESQDPGDRGYIPSLVTEDEPGHSPLIGNGLHAQPWYWGTNIETAHEVMDEANAKLGITPEEARDIVMSSLRASNTH